MKYQRAFEAVIWSMPAIGIYGFSHATEGVGGGNNTILAWSEQAKANSELLQGGDCYPMQMQDTSDMFKKVVMAQVVIDDGVTDTNKNMFNAGIGLSYKITPSWFVRTDARIFHSTNSDFNDNALTLTLGYRFNGGEKAD